MSTRAVATVVTVAVICAVAAGSAFGVAFGPDDFAKRGSVSYRTTPVPVAAGRPAATARIAFTCRGPVSLDGVNVLSFDGEGKVVRRTFLTPSLKMPSRETWGKPSTHATPNHHHALPTLLALRHGANAYVEKPMAHTMEEVLLIEKEAKRTGAVVRVGNKGHNMTHRPMLAKYLRDGVIGEVTEVFSYSDRPNTMFHRPPSCPPPKGMDWDLWCGGSPVCENYIGEDGRVGLHPHDWHSWIDYGNGSIGNMGTHVLDAPYQAMDMWKVEPSKVVVRDVKWGCPGAWNARGTVDFTIPARDGWDEITLHWNDGVADGVDMGSKFMSGWYNRVYRREHTNFPPELLELEKKWGVKTPITAFGTVFVGTKGMIYEEFHRTLRFFPEGGKIADLPVPSKPELAAEELRIVREFLGAVRGNPGPVNTGMDFSVPLAKTLMLTNALVFAGKGTYAWDGLKTSSEIANAHLKHSYRKGWELT